MKIRDILCLAKVRILDLQGVHQVFHTAFDIIKIDRPLRKSPMGTAVKPHGQPSEKFNFPRKPFSHLGKKHFFQLKELEARILTGEIILHGLHQAGNQRGSHDGEVFRQRIEDPESLSSRIVWRESNLIPGDRRGKAVIDHLMVAMSNEEFDRFLSTRNSLLLFSGEEVPLEW